MRFVVLISLFAVAAGCSKLVGEGDAALVPVAEAEVPAAARQQQSPASALDPRLARFAPGQRPVAAIDRVLIISIDGLRPDVLLRAYMPRVRELCSKGCFTFWAETSPEAYTLPCHASMFTGTPSEKHGVTWNDYSEES